MLYKRLIQYLFWIDPPRLFSLLGNFAQNISRLRRGKKTWFGVDKIPLLLIVYGDSDHTRMREYSLFYCVSSYDTYLFKISIQISIFNIYCVRLRSAAFIVICNCALLIFIQCAQIWLQLQDDAWCCTQIWREPTQKKNWKSWNRIYSKNNRLCRVDAYGWYVSIRSIIKRNHQNKLTYKLGLSLFIIFSKLLHCATTILSIKYR